MSIPVLIQTYDEVRRLAIAGSVVAPGDFRLKKLVTPLEQAGQKAPVFARVAEAVTRLVDSSELNSAPALLELATLINSILYTQGETGLAGELTPVPSVRLGRPRTQVSARTLKPLQEALTTTGSGRLEIIRDGYERGTFHDLRLITPALAAIDDSYAEIADLVAEKILPLYGSAIVPELQATFDPRGRGGAVRRLRLMHRLDPETARPYIQQALEEGSPELRVAAVGCLGDSPDDLPYLLDQVKSKARDVRIAALRALGRCGVDAAAQVLCSVIQRADLALAVDPLQKSRHPAVTSTLLDAAEAQLAVLLAGKEKDAAKLGPQNERMGLLLDCLKDREDPRTEKLLLSMFEQMGRLATIKGTPSGNDVIERLVNVMATGAPRVQTVLVDAHAKLPAESLGQAFAAACRSRDPAEVFGMFSPYLTANVNEKKKNRDPAWARREAIFDQLMEGRDRHDLDTEKMSGLTSLDPRWLDLAVQLDNSDLVQALARPGHDGARDYLSLQFQRELGKTNSEYQLTRVLETMIRIGHPGATDWLVELITKLGRSKSPFAYYGISYWIGRLIPRLPRNEALPKLEALLPSLPERMVDQLLVFLTESKQGSPTATAP